MPANNGRIAATFKKAGFKIVEAAALLNSFEAGQSSPEKIKDTLILMPSAELSRARGGFHCMSMPLLRKPLD